MLNQAKIFSSFSVNDIQAAKKFYSDKLGLNVAEKTRPGCPSMLVLKLKNNSQILIYPKEDHVPANFTVLNFSVEQIDEEVIDLATKGIMFEKYESTDEIGVNHNEGPLIAWFKDPAGNFLSVIEEHELEKSWDLEKTMFFHASPDEVFKYWVTPELLVQWACPDGMKLNVPKMERKNGGHYRFEHTGKNGVYIGEGVFTAYVEGEKIAQKESVRGPDGTIQFENLKCFVEFKDKYGGTEIQLIQSGFEDEESMILCEQAWDQSLDKLSDLIGSTDKATEDHPRYTDFY